MRSRTLVAVAIILASGPAALGEPPEVTASGAALSSDGQVIAVADDANSVHVYDLKIGKRSHFLKASRENGASRRTAVAVSADGRLVGYADENAYITIWDLSKKDTTPIAFETASTRKVVDKQVVRVHTIAFLPDRKSLLVAGRGGSIQCWDYTTKKLARTISEGAKSPNRSWKWRGRVVIDGMEFEEVEGTSNDSNGWESRAMAVSQDSKMVASTNGIDSIWLWDVATGKEIRKLSFDKSPQMYTRVASLSFSRDGKKLATVIGNQSGGSRSYIADYAAVWDVHEGKLTHEVPPKEKDGSRRTSYRSTIILTHAEFDVSGENLVIDHTVGNAVWEIATGKKSQSFTDGWRSFFRSFVHPDGELVIVVADRTLFCENKKTGKEVWRRELFR